MSNSQVPIERLEAKHPLETAPYKLSLSRHSAFSEDSGASITALQVGVWLLSSGIPTGVSLSSMIAAQDYGNITTDGEYFVEADISGGTNGYSYRIAWKVTTSASRVFMFFGDFTVDDNGITSFS